MKSALTAIALTSAATVATAGTSYNFTAITSNNAGDVDIAESQITVEVSQSAEFAYFKVINDGSEEAIVTKIAWDDNLGVLTGDVTTSASPGVSFAPSNGPVNLPAGNTVNFDEDFAIKRSNGQGGVDNGINEGEYGNFFIEYSSSFQAVIDALNSGELRIGIHVQGFETGGSEALITHGTPPSGVPTPTAALAGLALLGIAGLRRRRD